VRYGEEEREKRSGKVQRLLFDFCPRGSVGQTKDANMNMLTNDHAKEIELQRTVSHQLAP